MGLRRSGLLVWIMRLIDYYGEYNFWTTTDGGKARRAGTLHQPTQKSRPYLRLQLRPGLWDPEIEWARRWRDLDRGRFCGAIHLRRNALPQDA